MNGFCIQVHARNYISNMAPALIEEISSSKTLETRILKSSTVDKAHLAKVVEWQTNIATSVDFSWGKQMSPDDIVLSSLHFKNLGDVAVPVSTQVSLSLNINNSN